MLAALALVGLAAGVATVWPDEAPPAAPPAATGVPRAWAGSDSPFAAAAPVPAPAPAQPPPVPPASLSREVAPGVHVTPMGVPAGTAPRPAGPTAEDSEPEN